ncbi:MAG: DUF2752 domain-containing protein [Streptosporangiales bacterium]|nr:DUF2752 domain-containing protein [Streptosporangiales bacterium]
MAQRQALERRHAIAGRHMTHPLAPSAPSASPARQGRVAVSRGWPIGFSVERVDRHRVVTLFAVAGLAAGALLAAFGLPPVELHGPLHHLGIMGPTCGATRAVRLAMMGEWGSSFQHNPIGIPLVAGAVFLVLRTAAGALTGRWFNVRIRWTRLTIAVVVVAILALWINQQLHVDLIGPQR